MDEQQTTDARPAGPDDPRRLSATTVAASLIAWWPAFTLGVYGVVFFEQIFALWVAATAVFLVVVLAHPRELVQRPAWAALLVPSLWMGIAIALPTGGSSAAHAGLYWFGVVGTVLGLPVMAALLIRLLLPGAERVRGGQAVIALSVVGIIGLASFGIGRLHPRVLTCEDFSVSGNFAPPGCTPGEGTTLN